MNILYIFILSTVFYSYLFLVSDINKFAYSNILQIKKSKERYYFISGLLAKSIGYYKQYKSDKYVFKYNVLNNNFTIIIEYKIEDFDDYKEISINGKIFYHDNKLYGTFIATLKDQDNKISLIDYDIC